MKVSITSLWRQQVRGLFYFRLFGFQVNRPDYQDPVGYVEIEIFNFEIRIEWTING